MNRKPLSMLFVLPLCILLSNASLLFAETFQWTDVDGSIHFSDTPPAKASNDKQPIVQRDVTSAAPSRPSKKLSTTTSAANKQTSKQQSWRPDAACLEELRAFDKKLSKDEKLKNCTASIQTKSRQRYSPECLRQLDSKKFDFTPACQQEFQAVGQAMISELQQCTSMEALIDSNISSTCREQSERYKTHVAACGEIVQKITSLCGQNAKCYEEHKSDMVDCR